MINSFLDSGSMPVLERLVQFTSQRHKVLVNNIANLSTPYYKPTDLSPQDFQATLRRAIDQRRQSADRSLAPLQMQDTDELSFEQGRTVAKPRPSNDGLLYHDQNNRDLERTMQRLAENTLAHNAGIELIRSEFRTMEMAVRERI
jgi:flagellar basal-body rod protein FlgB